MTLAFYIIINILSIILLYHYICSISTHCKKYFIIILKFHHLFEKYFIHDQGTQTQCPPCIYHFHHGSLTHIKKGKDSGWEQSITHLCSSQKSIKLVVFQLLHEKYQGLINSQSKVIIKSFVSSTTLAILGLLCSKE